MNNGFNISPNIGKLILSRQNNFYGSAAKLNVNINGCIYTLTNGARYEFDLVPGIYTITWKAWCRRAKTIQINIIPGNYYIVDYKPDYLWGGFKLSEYCKLY